MSLKLSKFGIGVCLHLVGWCLFGSSACGDEFTASCLSAMSETPCAPFVGCVNCGNDCLPQSRQQLESACTPDCRGVDSSLRTKLRQWRAKRADRPMLRDRVKSRLANWRSDCDSCEVCSLSQFIQTVPNVEYHREPLSASVVPLADQSIHATERRSLSAISLDISPSQGAIPVDQAKATFGEHDSQIHHPGTTRPWNATTQYWQASLLCHEPVYFEDINLDRHGFSHGCCQPAISGTKFFTTVAILPYLIGADPPCCEQFVLGENRPGSHACYICQRPRFSLRGASVQASAVTGLIFLIP